MANSTDEYWDADGQSLHTYAWALETTSEHMRAAAALKGTDIPVSLRPGELWVPKVPGPRVITLKGWVRGCDQDGVWPDTADDREGLLNDNWNFVKALLWRTDRRISLTKRWRSLAGAGIQSATALAEFNSGLDNASVIDVYRKAQALKFTVDMRLSDPYFYGAEIIGATHSGSFTINNNGEDTARKVVLNFSGPGTLTNLTTGRAMTVSAGGTYDVWNFTAPGGHLKDVVVTGLINEAFWMPLARGANNFTSTVGVAVSYWPVFL